jgi:hypothetical protein
MVCLVALEVGGEAGGGVLEGSYCQGAGILYNGVPAPALLA